MVAVHWGHFEAALQACLINILGKDGRDFRAHAVFVHMAFPQKLDVLGAMIAEIVLPPEHALSRYREEILPRLKEASGKRNAMLHPKWGMQDGTVYRADIRARGAVKVTEVPTSIKDIQDASEAIINAAKLLVGATFKRKAAEWAKPEGLIDFQPRALTSEVVHASVLRGRAKHHAYDVIALSRKN